MNPSYFGGGTWIFIFYLLLEYNGSLEDLKKILYTICTTLPCELCNNHSRINFRDNKILECNDKNTILHFFIEFRNGFYNNKIDRYILKNGYPLTLEQKKYIYIIMGSYQINDSEKKQLFNDIIKFLFYDTVKEQTYLENKHIVNVIENLFTELFKNNEKNIIFNDVVLYLFGNIINNFFLNNNRKSYIEENTVLNYFINDLFADQSVYVKNNIINNIMALLKDIIKEFLIKNNNKTYLEKKTIINYIIDNLFNNILEDFVSKEKIFLEKQKLYRIEGNKS